MLSKKILSIPLILFALSKLVSPVLAEWTIDLDPPRCGITFNYNSPQPPNTQVTTTVTACDDPTTTQTSCDVNLGSGIISSAYTLFKNSSNVGNPYTNAISNGHHTFTGTATDGVGNVSATCTATFDGSNAPTPTPNASPLIQTTGGDIHSNTNVNLPSPSGTP